MVNKKPKRLKELKKNVYLGMPLGLKIISLSHLLLGLFIIWINRSNLLEHFTPAAGYISLNNNACIMTYRTPLFLDLIVFCAATLFIVSSFGLPFHKESSRRTALAVLVFSAAFITASTFLIWFERGFVQSDMAAVILLVWLFWNIVYLYSRKIKKFFKKKFSRKTS